MDKTRGNFTRRAAAICGIALMSAIGATPAAATPVATSDPQYQALGRVFPDPLAGCTSGPCSPNAQGNVPATQFIQWQEFLDGLRYMNSKPEWQRYMEVLVLDGELGENNGPVGQAGGPPADGELGVGSPGSQVFPGNDQPLEYDPKPEYRSVGLPTSTLDRNRSDLITVRVTDESVPDAGKERYALSLSIHGIERAGAEGGTRAIEDLVTAATTGRSDNPVVSENVRAGAPSFARVLRETIIYFTYPNPDGWRRGSITEGGLFFQRYNGNGVDLNRDWPDIGFTFRPYSGLSEPESRALASTLTEIQSSTGARFAAGDDLHGQPFADALSYTLLPHGRHDFAKNERIRDTAIAIHRASEEALTWSPIVQENEAAQSGGAPCAPGTPVGTPCAQIYGQTWGTVYDTINYTTTGSLGDWFDSSIGLKADGIDNEMSFSHLDKNILFDPHTEQLHVDGNKALIYAHLATIADPVSNRFEAPGRKGYVANTRVTREEKTFQAGPPAGTQPQDDLDSGPVPGTPDAIYEFNVLQGPQPTGENVFNGGMRVDVTETNVNGVGGGNAVNTLAIQCQGCDEHPGVTDDDEWVTVTEDYNQSLVYLQSGLTAAVNRPQATRADGSPVAWRAVVSGPIAAARFQVHFTSGPASTDGATGGDDPPRLAGYDIANTDFFEDLNPHIAGENRDFNRIDPRDVIEGRRGLGSLDTLVLADDPLPGYTGRYGGGGSGTPGGAPTVDSQFQGTASVPGAGSDAPGTFEDHPFTIKRNDANARVTVRIEWDVQQNDFDMYLYRVESNGDLTPVGDSASEQGTTDFEQIVVENPAPGEYVVRVQNFAAADPRYRGTIKFDPAPKGEEATNTGAYTVAEKNTWMEALAGFARGGGNLVLTDGALEALPDLAGIEPDAIDRSTVYAGQVAFETAEGEDTLDDETNPEPLTQDVAQEGARFGSGNRRQTFEPTPLGFAIQDESGSDDSNSRQFDIRRNAWEGAGGRIAGTSVSSSPDAAAPVHNRVVLGELRLGDGQIRVAGSLLPQPTTEFDHTLGLEPYATTYTGYILMRNLLDTRERGDAPGGPPGGTRCANVVAGNGKKNRLKGTSGEDRIRGKGGRDSISGRGGDDCLNGGGGRDRVNGNAGDDIVAGGEGPDRVVGGKGNDKVKGGDKADRLAAGKGADTVIAKDGRRDRVDCGGGKDVARVDKRDRIRRCEKVQGG
jgi:hypothetical protein